MHNTISVSSRNRNRKSPVMNGNPAAPGTACGMLSNLNNMAPWQRGDF
jgi:hypothetical protein